MPELVFLPTPSWVLRGVQIHGLYPLVSQ